MPSRPSPGEIGLPERYAAWRPGQFEAIENITTCDTRFDGHSMPTGSGKTGAELGAGLMCLQAGERAVVLTATKGLQDQIMDDAGNHIRLAVLKGKSNYECTGRPGWTCEDGNNGQCPNKGTERCAHSKAQFKALSSQFVLTNYSCWMASNKYGTGLGDFQHMFLDEAHAAFDELSNAVQVQLSDHEICDMLGCVWPQQRDALDIWKKWARPLREIANEESKKLKHKILTDKNPYNSWLRTYQHLRNLSRKLAMLATINPKDWIVDEWEHGYTFDAIRPSRYAEAMLYRSIPRVTFLSATLTEKVLHMVGVRENYTFTEYPSSFDPNRNPLIHVPTVHVNYNMTSADFHRWMMRADQIIGGRLDRKGIFHTVSFERAKQFEAYSEYKNLLVYNKQGDITTEIVAKFNRRKPPALLVSPSVSTGYDFRYDMCRYQIIGKVPWPNFKGKLVAARSAFDPQYGAHIAMQQLVQSCGRPMRSEDDWAENLCIDDGIGPFLQRNSGLAPAYFRASYRGAKQIPPPPEMGR